MFWYWVAWGILYPWNRWKLKWEHEDLIFLARMEKNIRAM